MFGRQRDADQLGGANDVGAEQLAVRQHVVDELGGVDDQVDGVGQPLPCLLIQAEVFLALVAGDDLEMVGSQFLVVAQQFGITTVEGLVHPFAGRSIVLGAHQADQLAVDQIHPLQPVQGQVAPEGTVKLVSWLVAAKIGGRDRCIVVVQGPPLPGRDHRPLRVAVSPVPAELS